MRTTMKYALSIALTVCMAINAETLLFQNGANGYTGCSDTYLIMNSASAQGAKDKLEVEGYHCPACIDERLLIKFDLSSIPKTTQIVKATMSLYCTAQPRPGSGTINIYLVPAAWDEAAATWTKAGGSVNWTKAGGDFNAIKTGSYTFGTDINVWQTIDVTTAVAKNIQNPETNFGFHFYMEPAMLTVRYASSNSTDQIHRPMLTLEVSGASVRYEAFRGYIPVLSTVRSANAISFFSSGLSIRKVTLCSIDGRVIASATGTGNRIDLNSSAVSSGMYFAIINADKNVYTLKIAIPK
jgi:hypothetical protein